MRVRTRVLWALALGAATAGPALAAAPAGAATSLGGFTVSALGEGSTASYEQPNAPIPATPTVELDEGYAATTDNFGPSGTATASVLYPGQVVANAGPELSSLEPGLPLPAAPVWPVQAQSSYPQSPNNATDDQPGVTMSATSSAGGNAATSRFGNAPSGGAGACASGGLTVPALPSLTTSSTPSPATAIGASSALAELQSSSATSASTTANGVAKATATATVTCVSLLGGLITVGSVTSSATATSNGTAAQLAGATTVTGAALDGEPVTIDGSGIHAAGQSSPSDPALPTLEQALTKLGITVTVTNPTDSVKGSTGSRKLDGLRISVDLTTLDKQADTYSALLPASVTSELPLPVPDSQVLVWDLATVDVQVAASPAFTAGAFATSAGPSATTAGASAGAAGALDATSAATPTLANTFAGTATTAATTASTPGSGTSGTGSAGGTPRTGAKLPTADAASSIPLAFKGIGAGLILLALLAAGALALGAARASRAAGDVASAGGFEPEAGESEGIVDVWSDALS
jgi:hypothetical protein